MGESYSSLYASVACFGVATLVYAVAYAERWLKWRRLSNNPDVDLEVVDEVVATDRENRKRRDGGGSLGDLVVDDTVIG